MYYIRDVYVRSIVLDGNFSASHLKQGSPEDDVWLTEGEGIMVERTHYESHINITIEIREVRGFILLSWAVC